MNVDEKSKLDGRLVVNETRRIISEYRKLRKNKSGGTANEVQDIRDELSTFTNLVGFDLLSNARNIMVMAELERKRAEAEKLKEYLPEVGREKKFSSVAMAKNQAFLDCMEYYQKEKEAEKVYYAIKERKEELSEFYKSVASRMRLLLEE
jgi:hypothetical protein